MHARAYSGNSPDAVPLHQHDPGWSGDGALPPALASGPDATKILQALKRRWLLAAGLGILLATAAAAAAWYLLAPPYTVAALVHISFVPPHVIGSPQESQREFAIYQKFQASQMKSRAVLTEAIARDEMRPIILAYQGVDPILWLQDEIKVETLEGSEIMTVSMSGSDPAVAMTILNAVVTAYWKEVVDKERERRAARLRELENIVTDSSNALATKVKTMTALADQLGTSESAASVQKQVALLGVLTEKKKQHASVQFDLIRLQSRLETHQASDPVPKGLSVPESAISQAMSGHPRAQQHQSRLARAEDRISQYEAVGARPSESGFEFAREIQRGAKKALAELRKELEGEMLERMKAEAKTNHEGVARQIEADIKPLARQEKELKTEIDSLTAEVDKTSKSSTDLERQRAEIGGDEKRLERYRDELAALQIELRSPFRVSKIQDAALQKQETKKQLLATAGAPVTVLLAVCFLVGWWESRARRIHSADEVATGLGLRVVGGVPQLPRAASRASTPEEQAFHLHGLIESIDGIRTVLLREANLDTTRLVLVTSAVSGEGKTTLASHLAGSLARAGRRTLLIDCDLRTPAAHQLFELPQQPGFSEVLLNEVHVAEATLSTQVENLWMIPGGVWDREVVQELAKDGVSRLFEKLRHDYDFVVIDSHPVLAATDSLLIGQHADAVILSLMREVSQAPRVYAACQKLYGLGIRVLGAVVNGLPESDVYVAGSRRAARSVA